MELGRVELGSKSGLNDPSDSAPGASVLLCAWDPLLSCALNSLNDAPVNLDSQGGVVPELFCHQKERIVRTFGEGFPFPLTFSFKVKAEKKED